MQRYRRPGPLSTVRPGHLPEAGTSEQAIHHQGHQEHQERIRTMSCPVPGTTRHADDPGFSSCAWCAWWWMPCCLAV